MRISYSKVRITEREEKQREKQTRTRPFKALQEEEKPKAIGHFVQSFWQYFALRCRANRSALTHLGGGTHIDLPPLFNPKSPASPHGGLGFVIQAIQRSSLAINW
jgi:hypothetical protein